MMTLKWIVIGLTVSAAATGFAAARYWLKSTKIEIDPAEYGVVPVDEYLANAAWLAAIIQASSKSAELNKTAAKWTAVSAALSVWLRS